MFILQEVEVTLPTFFKRFHTQKPPFPSFAKIYLEEASQLPYFFSWDQTVGFLFSSIEFILNSGWE